MIPDLEVGTKGTPTPWWQERAASAELDKSGHVLLGHVGQHLPEPAEHQGKPANVDPHHSVSLPQLGQTVLPHLIVWCSKYMKLPLITNPTEEQLQLRLVPEGEQRVRNEGVQPLQERPDLNHASVMQCGF